MMGRQLIASRSQLIGVALAWASVCQLIAATDARDLRCSEILRGGLAATNPDTRKQAVEALSIVAERFVPLLQSMLEDKDVQVRLAAVESLADVRNKRSMAALRFALDDEVPEVSFAAAKALWTMDDGGGKQELLAVLQGESKSASPVFSKEKRDAMRLMHVPQRMWTFAVRQGIGLVPIPYVGLGIASMHAILADPEVSGRAAAALLLGNDTDQATLDALKDALSDPAWSVRAAAVHSLALQNDPRFKDDLAPLLEDANEAVQFNAAAGFLRLSAMPDPPKAPVPSSSRHRAHE